MGVNIGKFWCITPHMYRVGGGINMRNGQEVPRTSLSSAFSKGTRGDDGP